jgi:hypothetical protein
MSARPCRPMLLLAAVGLVAVTVVASASPAASAGAPPPEDAPAFTFAENDCGPPSEEIPGPPPWLIVVGRPMSDSWLMCYIKRDFQGQDFHFGHWGKAGHTSFEGYPVECWTSEAGPGWTGRRTSGIIAQVYGRNRGGEQLVRFTYQIQLDGDYINNCRQEILEQP